MSATPNRERDARGMAATMDHSSIRSYAAREHIEYIDNYTSLAGPSRELKSDLCNDGVHPNRYGYAVMRRLLAAKLSGIAR